MTEPCDKCKKKDACEVFQLIHKKKKKGAWHLEAWMVGMYAFYQPVYLINASADCCDIKLECAAFSPNKKRW